MALSLVVGFAIAQGTGIRWLGALVLVFGGLYCAVTMWPVEGPLRTVTLGVVYACCFALSHPLAGLVGTWPAVLLVATGAAAVAYLLMRPTASLVSTTSPPDSSIR